MEKSYVYFMHAVGTDLYKIGWTSSNLFVRLDTIQVCCPYELEMICLIGGEKSYIKQAEKVIHNNLENKRFRGEWFSLNLADINWVSAEFDVLIDPVQIAYLLKIEKRKFRIQKTNSNRKREGKGPSKMRLVMLCKNPACKSALAGRQRDYCSNSCKQKVFRLRRKAA